MKIPTYEMFDTFHKILLELARKLSSDDLQSPPFKQPQIDLENRWSAYAFFSDGFTSTYFENQWVNSMHA